MGTIIFFMLPEMGHLNPSFKLARSLKRLGYRVFYLEAEDYEECISSQGFECLTVFNKTMPRGFLTMAVFDRMGEGWLNIPDAFQKLLADQSRIARDNKGEIAEIIERVRPDLFVVDSFLPAISLVAIELGCPCLFLNPSLNIYDHFFEGEFTVLKNVPELILCPREFDLPREQPAGRRRFYVEPSVDLERAEPAFPQERLSQNKPLVYCTMGSQNHIYGEPVKQLYRALIEAMATNQNWQLVLGIGPAIDPEELGRIPPNVLLLEHAPQLEVLKRAFVMITHGGLGSIKECILMSVPMIVFPLGRDQPRNGARVAFHRLGVRGNFKHLSPQLISSLIDRIDKDPSFKSNVEAMSRRFREMETLGRGAKIIDKTLQALKQRSA